MNRRNFLKSLTTSTIAGMAALSGNPLSPRIKLAHAAEGKTLVILFQRGGCDGLNTVVPYGDADYYSLRPTIAIAAPDSNNPESALNLDGFFGLHPGLAPLKPFYDANRLAVFPTVHYPNANRSHFTSQHYIESAYRSTNLDGWINRYLQTTPGGGDIRAISFGSKISQALRGEFTVSSVNDINIFNLGISEDESNRLLGNLSTVYDQLSSDPRAFRDLIHRFGTRLLDDISALRAIDASNYQPENGANYPNDTTSRQLKQVAQLIKSGIGLEAATVSITGWDTHSDQGGGNPSGRHYKALQRFAGGISAFVTDMGEAMQDVILLTCTEFGRTSAENGSLGTDHGHASTWFAIGGEIQGGVYGSWPGLAADQLHKGRYLAMTVDYRNIFGDILTRHMNANDLDLILPDHTYSPTGLFA